MDNFIKTTLLIILSCHINSSSASNSIKLEEQHSPRETIFKELEQHIERHLNHLDDAISSSKVLQSSTAGKSQEINTEQCIETLQQNINNINEMASFLRDVQKGAMSMKLFMNTLLDLRLRNLRKRKINLLRAKNDPNGIMYFLTAPEAIERAPESLQIFPEVMVDTYQTINKIIVGLLSLENLRTLPASTKKILRASPSLWDRIQGLDGDLGFPDEALLDFNSIDYDNPIQSAELLEFGELYYHDTYIIEQTPVLLHDHSSFYKSKDPRVHYLSIYDATQIKGENPKLKELPYPDFLMPNPRPIKIVKTKKAPQERSEKDITVKSEEKSSSDRITLKEEQKALEKPHFSSKISFKHEIKEVLSSSNSRTQDSFSQPIKHNNKALTFKPKITGKAFKSLSDIFDAKAFSNTTFSKFQTLWKQVGGTIEGKKSGGSHRSLLLNAKVIGGTFVPHGGHGYGKRCIKDLREALTIAGYGEDYLR